MSNRNLPGSNFSGTDGIPGVNDAHLSVDNRRLERANATDRRIQNERLNDDMLKQLSEEFNIIDTD